MGEREEEEKDGEVTMYRKEGLVIDSECFMFI